VNGPGHHAGVGSERMFNIVKRRDFILADDLPTRKKHSDCATRNTV
jgi:hypothetical protein